MAKAKPQMITAREFAQAIKRPYSTVTAWLAKGLVDGVEAVEVGTIKVWQVPAEAVKTFQPPKPGRPKGGRKAKAAKKPSKKSTGV